MMRMTMSAKVSATPVDLQGVHRDFAQWRRMRQTGARIPAALWASAVAMARRYSVSRTARTLHLEQRKLKHLASAATRAVPGAATPTFVEVLTPQPAIGIAECSIEVEGPGGGRVRISLRGMPSLILVALSRVVWGPEA